ncbi:DUF2169 domain-containing protein [Janthinobacterium sp. NKUCC06_STL]|uniref:DUF2169 family type VI secretion system accessory protein n=1 Tax=Janthinobacterium sp. NKUCC06_STL TaxID=2842127 RepID=UPI001C5BA0C6|nr:DUF2169 domain-containing protein [Janthinobacterium sp. NKUCC06_STL]MBW3512130.1 DUF2169 domain-containing protein [Janthinobacterium sp. NKUCC06_STL]
MNILNHTPFPAQVFESIDHHGQMFWVATLRQTLSFASGQPVFSELQVPLCERNSPFSDIAPGSVRQESDYCPVKPRCDVLVNATAHAPGNAELPSFQVRLRVTRPGIPLPLPERPRGLSPHMSPQPAVLTAWKNELARLSTLTTPREILVNKVLSITGRRYFVKKSQLVRVLQAIIFVATLSLIRLNPWRLTRAAPFRILPLRYEYAFGGECRVEADTPLVRQVPLRYCLTAAQMASHPANMTGRVPVAHSIYERNPFGVGYAEKWYLRAMGLKQVPAPQIEAAGRQMTVAQFWQSHRSGNFSQEEQRGVTDPIGLGVRSNTHPARRILAGTIDEAFIAGTAALPADFDEAYWNCAPQEQQIPYLRGDERFELTNLCPANTAGAFKDKRGNTVLHLMLPQQAIFLLLRQLDGSLATLPLQVDTVIIEPDSGVITLVWRSRWTKTSAVAIRTCEFRARPGAWPGDSGAAASGQRAAQRSRPEKRAVA